MFLIKSDYWNFERCLAVQSQKLLNTSYINKICVIGCFLNFKHNSFYK